MFVDLSLVSFVLSVLLFVFFFFFFQAEDGIRDADVTGVQTCALPISPVPSFFPAPEKRKPSPALLGEREAFPCPARYPLDRKSVV